MRFFECCHYCVAPKRYPGCHSTCSDYIKQKKLWDANQEAIRQDTLSRSLMTPARKAAFFAIKNRKKYKD